MTSRSCDFMLRVLESDPQGEDDRSASTASSAAIVQGEKECLGDPAESCGGAAGGGGFIVLFLKCEL